MPVITRRGFLAGSGLAAAGLTLPRAASAAPSVLSLPPGLQLWSVKEELAKDFAGTLRALKAMGYARVEAAGWADRSPAEFRVGLADAGLECFSCHFSMGDLIDNYEAKLAEAREVGVRYVVASSPHPAKPAPAGLPWQQSIAQAMTLADWQRNAEAMNRIGALAKALGMRFGYHNHSVEFLDYDGRHGFHELIRITDPALVTFELDLAWVAGAGMDPAHVLHEHGARIELLHVKDLRTKARTPGRIVDDVQTVPVGSGTIDWRATFGAAAKAPIAGWFVEQEPPFAEPVLKGLGQSLAYLKTLRA